MTHRVARFTLPRESGVYEKIDHSDKWAKAKAELDAGCQCGRTWKNHYLKTGEWRQCK